MANTKSIAQNHVGYAIKIVPHVILRLRIALHVLMLTQLQLFIGIIGFVLVDVQMAIGLTQLFRIIICVLYAILIAFNAWGH